MTESTSERLSELYDLREAFEVHAVGTLAARIAPHDRHELRRLCHELTRILTLVADDGWTQSRHEHWLLAEAAFHLLLIRACGNNKMLWAVVEFDVMPSIFGIVREDFSTTDHGRIQRQHQDLLAAIFAGDVAGARSLVQRHLESGRAIALRGRRSSPACDPAGYGRSAACQEESLGKPSLADRVAELQRLLIAVKPTDIEPANDGGRSPAEEESLQ